MGASCNVAAFSPAKTFLTENGGSELCISASPMFARKMKSHKSFNDWGGDLTIPSWGLSPENPLPGVGLYDPLQGRQACLEFNSFHHGVGQICPWEGLFSCRPLQKRRQVCDTPHLLNDSHFRYGDGIVLSLIPRRETKHSSHGAVDFVFASSFLFSWFLLHGCPSCR